MQDNLLPGLAIAWLLGTWLRVYRQARYYQIEEYMSRRFLAWVRRNPDEWLPRRPLLAWLAGMLALILLQSANGELPWAIAVLSTIVVCYPPRAREIKKPLIRTGRMKRILVAAVAVSTVSMAFASVYSSAALDSRDATFEIAALSALGMLLFLLAPIWLTLGNLLLQPYEAFMRRLYLNQARKVLSQVQPKIIGITGSYGKTTTKVFLRDLLNLRYRTYATPKSYNTLMGISLAINSDLAEDFRTEYLISEMGAYVPGEIERICELTPPDIAIVTEIGPQHLERFGTLENTKRAKYEIVRNLRPDGVAVFNWDNKYIREMAAAGYPETRLTVSRNLDIHSAEQEGVTWIASEQAEDLAGLRFVATHIPSGEKANISTAISGEHNVTNLLLCIAVAYHEGVPLRDIARRIGSLQPAESRLVRQVTAAGITIINDAYSANPVGVKSALKALGMHVNGKRLLVTPGMIELGELQDQENYKLGLLAAEHATDVILIGREQTKSIHQALQSERFPVSRVKVVDTLVEAITWYQQHLVAGDVVLFLNDLPDTY